MDEPYSNIEYRDIKTDQDFEDLRRYIFPQGSGAENNIISQLKRFPLKGVIIEKFYFDKDYSFTYSNFYSKLFRMRSKICQRIHFFSSNVTDVFKLQKAVDLSQALQEIGDKGHFIGFIVKRPVPHAPIEKSVIKPVPDKSGTQTHLLVKSEYEAHLLGAQLKVAAMPHTEQDQRVGACAQASIWMAGRHFHERHRGPWISTFDITEAATRIIDDDLSSVLPAGSEFLSIANMVQALRKMDRNPLTYSTGKPEWNGLNPEDVIQRYIDSGIPVILGLQNNSGMGHAVVATGHRLRTIDPTVGLPYQATRSVFCDAFLINDDQRGANLFLPISKGNVTNKNLPFSVGENVKSIIIPLPDKVYFPAEKAEKVAWGTIKSYEKKWRNISGKTKMYSADVVRYIDDFVKEFGAGNVIARTYLTWGWKYKSRIINNRISDTFKNAILRHELPKYVWVTEFGTLTSLNEIDSAKRTIFAHTVIDATASEHWECRCLFHAPGLVRRWFHDAKDPTEPFSTRTALIKDERPYSPKVRGE
ncbi:MAG: hypothetical protein ACPGOV_01915 [Magnetovibrionaceae bacterium]